MNTPYGKNDYRNYLLHADRGGWEWDKHKYIRKEGNTYIYPEDLQNHTIMRKGPKSNTIGSEYGMGRKGMQTKGNQVLTSGSKGMQTKGNRVLTSGSKGIQTLDSKNSQKAVTKNVNGTVARSPINKKSNKINPQYDPSDYYRTQNQNQHQINVNTASASNAGNRAQEWLQNRGNDVSRFINNARDWVNETVNGNPEHHYGGSGNVYTSGAGRQEGDSYNAARNAAGNIAANNAYASAHPIQVGLNNAIRTANHAVNDAYNNARTWVTDAADTVKDWTQDTVNGAREFASRLPDYIPEAANEIRNDIEDAVEDAGNGIRRFARNAGDYINDEASALSGAARRTAAGRWLNEAINGNGNHYNYENPNEYNNSQASNYRNDTQGYRDAMARRGQSAAAQDVLNRSYQAAHPVQTAISNAADYYRNTMVPEISNVANSAVNGAVNAYNNARNAAGNAYNNAVDAAQNAYGTVRNTANSAYTNAREAAAAAYDQAMANAERAYNAARERYRNYQ